MSGRSLGEGIAKSAICVNLIPLITLGQHNRKVWESQIQKITIVE